MYCVRWVWLQACIRAIGAGVSYCLSICLQSSEFPCPQDDTAVVVDERDRVSFGIQSWMCRGSWWDVLGDKSETGSSRLFLLSYNSSDTYDNSLCDCYDCFAHHATYSRGGAHRSARTALSWYGLRTWVPNHTNAHVWALSLLQWSEYTLRVQTVFPAEQARQRQPICLSVCLSVGVHGLRGAGRLTLCCSPSMPQRGKGGGTTIRVYRMY